MATMQLVASGPADTGTALLDAHSAVHLGVGILAGSLGWSRTVMVLSVIGYEIALAAYRSNLDEALSSPRHAESLGNQFADVLVALAGYQLGKYVAAQRERVVA